MHNATAGVMTTRAAARAFFIDGTNRAMFRFTMLNHFCNDMEQVLDTTRSPDRIRQDVSRSPGGDSRVFLNNCVGCHSGMDPLAQAFAYYDYRVRRHERPGRGVRQNPLQRQPVRPIPTPEPGSTPSTSTTPTTSSRASDAGRCLGQLLACRPERPARLG
jgi:hypothetical protein